MRFLCNKSITVLCNGVLIYCEYLIRNNSVANVTKITINRISDVTVIWSKLHKVLALYHNLFEVQRDIRHNNYKLDETINVPSNFAFYHTKILCDLMYSVLQMLHFRTVFILCLISNH